MEQNKEYQPALWAVTWPEDDGDKVDPQFVYSTLEEAEEMVKDCYGRGVVVQLYTCKVSGE